MSEAFPVERLFHPLDHPDEAPTILARVGQLASEPLSRSQLNQLLHLSHEAGIEAGFFRYYFLTQPTEHPYLVPPSPIELESQAEIISEAHLVWGLERFALDAAFFFGDFRHAYRELRGLPYDDLVDSFAERRLPTAWMLDRGPVIQPADIDVGDRFLVSELACKALDEPTADEASLCEASLVQAFERSNRKPTKISTLVELAVDDSEDVQTTLALPLATADIGDEAVASEDDIRLVVDKVRERFSQVRDHALRNTTLYLSFSNELDVYVATSMRERNDFVEMAESCQEVFGDEQLTSLNLRWFDPTLSACESHEDKGLIECLMVDQARLVLYFAGRGQSWGKDAEAAMALSRGTPVIIYCRDDDAGKTQARMFRDVHPLSRLADLRTGVAVGALITTSQAEVVELMRRLFANEMSYSFRPNRSGFVVVEELTGSAVRTITGDRMIRETFWNYYHSVA